MLAPTAAKPILSKMSRRVFLAESGKVRLGQVWLGLVRLGRVRLGEVRFCSLRVSHPAPYL